jgi:CBS domain-containing protein
MSIVTVRELMTRPVISLGEGDSLERAAELMRVANVRHLPVVRDGLLVGVVSQRDVLRHSPAPEEHLKPSGFDARQRRVRLGEIMSRAVVTVAPDSHAKAAAELLLRLKIGCVPVVDAEGTVLGILTETDFVRLSGRQLDEAEREDAATSGAASP